MLEEVWHAGAIDAKGVHACVGRLRATSLNTVQSALERLFRKGLLQREKISHAYRYTANISRQELVGRLIESTVRRIAGDRPEVLMSAFFDFVLEADDEQLRQLEALIAQCRAGLNGDP